MITLYEKQQRLIFHEGLRLKPYRCTKGKWTIGVGRCLDTNPLTEVEKRVVGDVWGGITKNAALFLLRNDLEKVEKQCSDLICWGVLDDERRYALIDMAFQLGINGLRKFKKMLSALEKNDYITASNECMDSNYAKQTRNRAERISRLIKTGRWVL